MKRYILVIFFFLFSIIGIFYFNFLESDKPTLAQRDLVAEYPNEWMYNQRAYPTNFINRNAIEEALIQSKSILAQRESNSSADWNFIGPLNTGGRVTDVAISPDNDAVLYVTTAVGGVFKTVDAGQNWTPVFDEIGKPSIGNIAIAPSNAQRIYVGTGEANGSATSGAFYGNGIYKSDDAGTTWTHVGLENSDHIGRIAIDPTNPDRVFAAATGSLYGYNAERGVYRTTNGGNSWDQVLFVTDSTSAIDVVVNPQNTDIVFAAMWERTRKPWIRDYGGVSSAIHRSTDGGNTWIELGVANGLPAPDTETGRIGLAISESNPSTIYARYTTNEIANYFNGLYRSDDNGDTWTLVTLTELLGIDASFGWYFGNIRVNPTNPDEVYVLGQSLSKTTNGGVSWQGVSGMHVDHHAMEYSRTNPNFILAGNDGGAYVSQNGGSNWTKFTNLPITQFYNIEVDYMQPNRLYGGTQDNNTIRTLTAGTNDWNSIIGGDGFHVNVDPSNNDYVYGESQWGNLRRSTDGGNNFTGATDGIDGNDRVNWNTPVVLSPFNPEKVFYGSNRLYISDRAVFWNPISPDLTNGQHPSGSLAYGTLTAIAPSHNNLDVIYTGSDDGKVHVTFDGGSSWNDISSSLPDRYVTSIAISPSDDLTAYITFSGFGFLDYDPHVFRTNDGGQNWVDISGNLPSVPANDIIINEMEDILLVATDLNVWYSQNDGGSWTILGNDLPMTIVRDLKLHEPTNTLYAGTFGRSMHSYDLSNIILNVNETLLANAAIRLYPNPSASVVTVEHLITSNGSIYLYDQFGRNIKTVYDGNLADSQNLTFSIDGISSGVYFVQLKTEGHSITKKLIVQ